MARIIPTIQDMIDIVNKRKILKKKNGNHYWAKHPTRDPNLEPTPNQLKVHENFKRCSSYAKEAIKVPALKDAYQLMVKNVQTAFNSHLSMPTILRK